MKPKLVSFATCPFVQRSVILLNEKGIDYDIEYIDLFNKPDWFLAISPFGKVPVLQVGDDVIFESAVIAEYLDEVHPPSMHPSDPVQKAKNRAWTEFASNLFMQLFQMSVTPSAEDYREKVNAIKTNLRRLEGEIQGPYFNGETFNMVDANFAPFFMRTELVESKLNLELYQGLDKVTLWKNTLLSRKAVQTSVLPDFHEQYMKYIQKRDGYLASQL